MRKTSTAAIEHLDVPERLTTGTRHPWPDRSDRPRSGLLVAGLLSGMLLLASGLGCNSGDGSTQVGFSAVRAEEVTDTSAMIRFETSIPTTCEVEYGLQPDALTLRAADPTMGQEEPFALDHAVPLSGLEFDSEYFYRARVEAPTGKIFYSEVYSFTTNPDTTPADLLNVALAENGASILNVSSNFGGGADDATWGALKAVDGDLGTEWATDGDGTQAYLTLDLGQPRTITELRFRSRQMADGSSIISRVSLLDGEGTVLGTFDTPDPAQLYTFVLEPPVITQIVRIEAVETTGGNTGAKEIQLWAPRPTP